MTKQFLILFFILQFAGCASNQQLRDMAVPEPLASLLRDSGFSAVPACRLEQRHKDKVVQSILSSRLFLTRLAELNELRRGFELLGVLHLLENNTDVLRPMLCVVAAPPPVSLKDLKSLLVPRFTGELNSNERQAQKSLYTRWLAFLEECAEGKFFSHLQCLALLCCEIFLRFSPNRSRVNL